MNRCMYEAAHGTLPHCRDVCKSGPFEHCPYYYIDEFYQLANEWKKEAGVKEAILIQKDMDKRTITIYTTRPGYFIGYKGELIEKYKNK